MTFKRPKSPEDAEQLVDLLSTEQMGEEELNEIAALVAPNHPYRAVELISELQNNPVISEPILEYYSRQILNLAAENRSSIF